ncbi:Helicase-like [Macleaya cordata]|uniref:Regulator of telomere elongation helicase 1 homolog n=1 Tax=Macleaya cordata TaxID=56857 RepID=A0A200QTU7_MACCD|nr:Helicase-like [Macleaya cordata]
MPIYKIRGIDVDFPFEAYDCQIVYMEKVIQSLQNKSNALLESPTGTGKTLCLLCSTLAWRKSLGNFSTGATEWKTPKSGSKLLDDSLSSSQPEKKCLPTIVYTSRTHSQLHQVIQELKRTNYRPRMIVLGSREQLCIHNDVRMLQGRAQTNACHFLCRKRKCSHQKKVPEYLKDNPNLGDDPVDIEDLVNIGRNQGPCPYYVSREVHKVVDIVFAPYNYLIDRNNRGSLTIDFWNSVLIFDEAHNLESICADAASFDLPSSLLTSCISEAKKCIDLSIARRAKEKSNEKALNPDNYAILKALLLKLEKRIAEVPIDSKELGFTRPGPYIYQLLADLNITNETANMLIDTIDNASLLLEDAENENSTESGLHKPKSTTACRLESIGDILKIIFGNGETAHAKSYRVHVQETEAKASDSFKGKKTSRTLSWWCFNPGIAMAEFSRMGVGSIILTSGTLSPLDSFAQELKLEFPIRLENPHVISSNQIWAGVVPSGPSACAFNSSYRNRDSLEYKQELGNAIANFARIVPNGLLVFFPSYYLMDQCIGCWKDMGHASSTNSSTIWERICKYKQPVVEPKQSSLFSSSIEDYMTKLKDTSTSGAVFFAVCRGKVSEGLDFADHAGRAVVITGLPFPMRNDPKIRLKREFLDQQALSQTKEQKVLTGEEWYSQQESRAVNQAVGRVIRHRHDYGAIIFSDERFAHSNRQSQISLWLQPHIKCYSKFGEVVFTLTRFFRDIGISTPMKPKSTNSISMGKYILAKPFPYPLFFWPLSSLLAASRSNTSDHLENVVPANCSTLNPYNHYHHLTLQNSRGLLKHNKLQTSDPKRKDPLYKKSEVIDLTSSSHWDEQPSTAELIAPCSSKKPKLLKIDTDLSCYTNISERHGKRPQLSPCDSTELCIDDSIRNMQHAQVASEVLLEDDITTDKSDFKHKRVPSSSVPCDEETRGAAFLIQVQEKLSVAEYKEFVGYMKALKSKTMKINHVLQSIARLFSTPERFLLLIRFKDYVPAKYRPMYEQYLKNS